MSAELPMRFRILHYLSTVKEGTCQNIMDALHPEYGTEGQFTAAVIGQHLLSMLAGGLLATTSITMDGKGELIVSYAIADLGRSRLKYLPKSWK